MYSETRRAGFGAEEERRIMIGTYALSAGYFDAYYGQAQRVRTLIRRDFAEAFGDWDALVLPTARSRFSEKAGPMHRKPTEARRQSRTGPTARAGRRG